ncbi:hypothetical protein [Erythrobacter sp. JK5]|uniref:hypothetical protein n=1 Tax=Erythrobacter sp. JK5 TaxID=2829500 RepID=UPI001BA55EDD|nr:hypothetical protein [Erythrobacter sp. JK5]QUL37899.1 hypothetical protein KDC96_00200 [Erythrobacter sp. JK5]
MNASQIGARVGGEGTVGRGWRTFFWIAMAFNFLIGTMGMLSPEATVDARIIGLLVFSFGVIYLLVARDPARFAPVLWAGVIGKIGVVALLGPETFGENGDRLIAGVLVLDGVFALGFLAFLLTRGESR